MKSPRSKILQDKKIVMMILNDFTLEGRVLKEARSAQKAGMRVTVLAKKSLQTKFREKINGVEVLRIQTAIGKLISFFKRPSRAERKSKETSERTIVKNRWLSQYLTLIDMFFANRLFLEKIQKLKPDIVHANDPLTLPAAFKLKKIGYKIVYDAHELYSESLAKPPPLWKNFFVFWEKKINSLDGMFSVCPSIIKELDKRYHTRNLPRAILYNAPPYFKKNLRKPDGKIKLLFIGTSYSEESFHIYFKAVGKLKNTTLTNIGTKWEKSDFPGIINKPPMAYDQLHKEINHYDIGIIPYVPDCLNNYFSTPNKLFSYMMGGLAIASSDLVEIRRIVKEANNGVLFNPKSSKDIIRKVNFLIQHPDILNQYKKNSLLAAKKYSWEAQEKKQIKLYESIINEN